MDSEVIPLLHCRCLRSILFTLFVRSWVHYLICLHSILLSTVPSPFSCWLRFEIGVRSQKSFLFGSISVGSDRSCILYLIASFGLSFSMSTSLAHVLSKTACRFVGVFVLVLLSALSVYARGKLYSYVEHGVHEAVARAVGGPGVGDMYEGSWGEMCVTVLGSRFAREISVLGSPSKSLTRSIPNAKLA